jgi:hypothetical protein
MARTPCLATCFAICLVLGAQAEEQAAEAPRSRERLLASPPPDWQLVYQFNNVDARLSEFVPPNESANEWTTKVVFESHLQLDTTDPIDLIMAEVKRLDENCTFVQHFNLFSGVENGYPSSARLILCGENKPLEKGEVSIFKAVQGSDYLYVVRIFKRVPPFEVNQPDFAREDIATWSNYVSRIHLCEVGDDEHPCPDDNAKEIQR